MATGDAISQLVVERTKKFDFVRNGRFLVFGVFIGVRFLFPVFKQKGEGK